MFFLGLHKTWLCVCVWARVPALWIVHEEQVEQPVSSFRQPSEFILEVIVRLLPQTILPNERQFRKTLCKTQIFEFKINVITGEKSNIFATKKHLHGNL